MVEVESRIEKWAAGATKPDEATARGKIVEFSWWLEKEGYKLSTIKHKVRSMKWLTDLGANIFEPETVKEAIAKKQSWDESTKAIVCDDYGTFLEMQGLTWRKPSYKHSERMPFIPLESELDALINAAGKMVGAFLQGLKDTGADPSELANAKWTDVNPQNKTIVINYPVKGHNPRILSVSDEFLRRLSTIPKKHERLFNINNVSAGFYQQRKSITRKLNNPRIKKISLTTFRHWKGTIEYHKTKDPYHVKKLLGHKKLTSTEVYINLDQAIFEESDDFIVKVANNVDEACKLIETGFEYVTDMNGLKIFKKRK